MLNSLTDASSYDAKDVNVENTHSGHLHNDHDVKPLMQHHINNGDSTASRQVLPSSHQIKHDTAGNMMDPPNNLEAAMGQRLIYRNTISCNKFQDNFACIKLCTH